MARLTLIQSGDPRHLLEAAAADFLRPPEQRAASDPEPYRSPSTLLVLRQGGLRDDLFRTAGLRGVPGWFNPPICLFQHLGDWFGATSLRPCDDYERLVLVSHVLRQRTQSVFSRVSRPEAFADAVDRFFGELAAEGVTADGFEAACASRTDRDEFEQARDRDLTLCYRIYCDELERNGRRDGRDGIIDCARAIRASSAALVERLGGRRTLHIVGLQDLRGGWNELLDALRESDALDDVRLFSTNALAPLLRRAPDELLEHDVGDTLAARLFVPVENGAPGAATVACFSAPDVARELEEVARRVRALVDSGVAAQDIAVIARSARPYVNRAIDALAVRGIPATARLRNELAKIPIVRSVLSLFRVAAEGWSRYGLVELAEQPYFARRRFDDGSGWRLDASVLNDIGYRRRVTGLADWTTAHEQLLAAAEEHEHRLESGEEDELRSKDAPPPATRVRAALDAFRAFAERAAEFDEERPLEGWVRWLKALLEEDAWGIGDRLYRVPDSRFDVARMDDAGLRGLRKILDTWLAALESWPAVDETINVATFDAELRRMLSGDVALWTPVQRGVQVVEALAAAQRSFDHVFLIGLSGQNFPLRSPRSPILDNRARRQLVEYGMSLDTQVDWESREQDLLRVLVASARTSLTFSWHRSDSEGRDVAPSAYAEELVMAAAGETAWTALAKLESDPEASEPGWSRVEPRAAGHVSYAHGDTGLSFDLLSGSMVVGEDLPLLASEAARGFARHAATIESIRRTGNLSPWNGLIEDPSLRDWLRDERLAEETYVWSPTQIEGFAKCAWAWFSQRLLRLNEMDDPDLDVDPLVRGTVLHDALRRFHERAIERRGPALLRRADLDWALPMVTESLDEAIDAFGPDHWLGPAPLRALKRAELRRMIVTYIEWEAKLGDDQHTGHHRWKNMLRTAAIEHEVAFGESASGQPGVFLSLGGVGVRMRGSIDRVEIGIDDRIDDAEQYIAAVDYKTSKYSTPGSGAAKAWQDGVVLQPALYARILEEQRGVRVARIEYRSIRDPALVHSCELVKIKRTGMEANEEARASLDGAVGAAGQHIARARAGEYPARPAPSCMCPPFCHAWDICRVKGGPRTNRGR